jgi:hypothetical protein
MPTTWCMMRSGAVALMVVLVHAGLSLSLASCSGRSCEQAEQEYHARLDECGREFFLDGSDDHVCDDVKRQEVECRISCLEAVSCAAVRGDADEEGEELFGCLNYCEAFFYQAIPSEEAGQ